MFQLLGRVSERFPVTIGEKGPTLNGWMHLYLAFLTENPFYKFLEENIGSSSDRHFAYHNCSFLSCVARKIRVLSR